MQDVNCSNPRETKQAKPHGAVDKMRYQIRNADYQRHLQTATRHLRHGALRGLKAANQGLRTINDYTDSFIASQEIARVRRGGNGGIEPLGCNYVGGEGVDREMRRTEMELLEPQSDQKEQGKKETPPSPPTVCIAMISERVEELLMSRRATEREREEAKEKPCNVENDAANSEGWD